MRDRDYVWCLSHLALDQEEELERLCPACRARAEEARCPVCGAIFLRNGNNSGRFLKCHI